MMLTVQMTIGTAETDRRKGSIHNRYQGYMTGASKSEVAIGQAKAPDEKSADLVLTQIAVSKPASNASPAATWEFVTRSSIANTGPLKRKLCT
jgi:hypothetical protein